MKKEKHDPVCDRTDCAACMNRHCTILVDNNFGDRECPFFKTWDQNEEEIAYCRKVMSKKFKGE